MLLRVMQFHPFSAKQNSRQKQRDRRRLELQALDRSHCWIEAIAFYSKSNKAHDEFIWLVGCEKYDLLVSDALSWGLLAWSFLQVLRRGLQIVSLTFVLVRARRRFWINSHATNRIYCDRPGSIARRWNPCYVIRVLVWRHVPIFR